MVGHNVESVQHTARVGTGDAVVLEVGDLWVQGDRDTFALKGVTFGVRRGEIVGIAGVAGNGQRELAEAIGGLRSAAKGAIRVDGRRLRGADARASFEAGVGYIPEDRLGTGVSPSLSLAMNLDLRSFHRNSFGPFLRLRRMREQALAAIRDYDIKASGPEMEADHLSGGNLQKLVIARELSGNLKLLVAASPTRGLDVAAVEAVHRHLLDAAAAGTGILLISEDLDEILALSDRIFVIYEGILTKVRDRDNLEEIGLRMTGGTP
jgi:simple sugar transport system ATP-binding protein